MVDVGAQVPNLTVRDDAGTQVSLSEIGRPLVLYFYPKADTPGCTNEATQFRDLYDEFRKKGAEIVGVSRDDVGAQAAFKDKYELPFRLLADVDSQVCDAFGVIVERVRDGKTSQGVGRVTFLIGKDGAVARVWPSVTVEGHAQDVLAALG